MSTPKKRGPKKTKTVMSSNKVIVTVFFEIQEA